MDKLLEMHILQGQSHLDTCLLLQIERTRKDGTTWQEEVRIAASEAIKIVDDTVPYVLNSQTRPFNPKYIQNFNLALGKFVSFLFEKGGLSVKEYCDFVCNRLHADIKKYFPTPSAQLLIINLAGKLHPASSPHAHDQYIKRLVFCAGFFECYLPEAVREKYSGDFRNMLSSDCFEILYQKNIIQSKKIGGSFIGCYVDDLDRTRPLTSPKEGTLQMTPDAVLEAFQIAIQNEMEALTKQ